MTGTRFFRAVGFLGVLFFFVSGFTPVPYLVVLWLGVSPDLVTADAIVVVAGYVSGWGTLSDASIRRTYHGIRLYQNGLAPLLVLSGGAPEGGPTEADVRAELAKEKGVPSQAILKETEARTTREEARREWALLQPRGAHRILLVTDSLHMLRARPVFERAGFEVHPAPPDSPGDPVTPQGRLGLVAMILEQLLALFYYWGSGFQ